MFLLFFSPFMMLGMFLASIVIAIIMGILTLTADKIVSGPPKTLYGLKSSMALTGTAVFLGSIAVLYGVIWYTQASAYWIYGITVFVVIFIILQWLFSPWIIKGVYKTRKPTVKESWLKNIIDKLSGSAELKNKPKLVIAEVNAPNAFAFGSPLTGNYVAVTKGLLELMPKEEIEAVLGHELGHLKHRDVTVILALSLIPVAIFYLGRMLLMWGWLAGDNRRNEGVLYYIGLGIALVAIGFIFQFLVTHFNRLREYYADAFSAKVTGWPSNLQRGLARLTLAYKTYPEISAELNKTAAMLFIVNYMISVTGHMAYDPMDYFWFPRKRTVRVDVDIDKAVEQLMKKKESSVIELFSSHPPVSKRLRFLENLKEKMGFNVPLA